MAFYDSENIVSIADIDLLNVLDIKWAITYSHLIGFDGSHSLENLYSELNDPAYWFIKKYGGWGFSDKRQRILSIESSVTFR